MQALLIALPNELLGSILRRAWADRPARPAAEEARVAAGLASLCRRVRKLLRERPLPLALDFSASLSGVQRRWLLVPAQAGRVVAAKLFVEVKDRKDGDALWEPPLLQNCLALHGHTLRHLSGVPLQLVAWVSEQERPALDLSGLRLTKLGVDCCVIGPRTLDPFPQARWWMWPECLPGALEELELLGIYNSMQGNVAWAQHPSAVLAGRLPRLHTIRVTAIKVCAHPELIQHRKTAGGFSSLAKL